MSETFDEDWIKNRGMEILAVGVASINYSQASQDLVSLRNQETMMSDPTIREGFEQKNIAEGLKAAGLNVNGAMAGFMGRVWICRQPAKSNTNPGNFCSNK